VNASEKPGSMMGIALPALSRVLQQSALSLAGRSRSQGRMVERPIAELRLHPTLVRLNLIVSLGQVNQVLQQNGCFLSQPILITTNRIIISGFKDWYAAVSDARSTVGCIEYQLSDEEALHFILLNHQSGKTLNSFSRIRVALELEGHFRLQAIANQKSGGKYKGLANLPEAEHVDVRQEISAAAGVGVRNVSNVKTILKKADPRVV
jgi:hypothetical protein